MGIVLQFQGGVGGQKMLKPTLKDVLLVENLNVRKIRKNEAIDFKSNIVSKPWGVEYLCGRNKNLEVWELYIKPKSATSLHCHPDKDTLNIVLEGSVLLETIGKYEILRAGDFRLLKAGVVHKTVNFNSKSLVRVLEIESPPNKYNLIRVKDDYGRESLDCVKFHVQKNAKHIKVYSCFSKKFQSNRSGLCMLHEFIPRTKNANRSIGIYELLIRSMSFKDSKSGMAKNLMATTSKNLILAAGSLSLYSDNDVMKLLPGNCVFDVPLEKFNWSSRMARALIW